jgi:hypothetical protein
MSAVDEALAEVEGLLPAWRLQREGLEDFSRLNLEPKTSAAVDRMRQALDVRLALCTAALDALRSLVANGYPGLPTADVDVQTVADLQAQIASLTAALARFAGPNPAVGGEIVFSPTR